MCSAVPIVAYLYRAAGLDFVLTRLLTPAVFAKAMGRNRSWAGDFRFKRNLAAQACPAGAGGMM